MMNVEQRQLVKKRMLLDLKEILDDMDIPFWLHSGVLLGYYRDRDLIPHDPDLDIGVERSKIPANFADRLARRLENTDMRLVWRTDTCLKVQREMASGDYLMRCDIFIHEKTEDGLALTLSNKDCSKKITYLHSLVSGACKAKFLGETFIIPDNPLQAIYRAYGPGWSAPVTQYKWDSDPKNIVGKPTLFPDETPKSDVVKNKSPGKDTLSLGPLTKNDAATLAGKSGTVTVYANQKPFEAKSTEFVECDETHCRHVLGQRLDLGRFDCVVIPHPELYNGYNLRELVGNAWRALKDGGKLVVFGPKPACISEFMFEENKDGSFSKYEKHENWQKNVTAVVTTYESHEVAKQCIESIRKHYPDMRVVVADNSKNPKRIEGSLLVKLPEDAGLSASRNAGVLHVNTPYVFLTDDDQHVEDGESLKKMYDSMIDNELDIVGGSVVHSIAKVPSDYTGLIYRYPTSVELKHGCHKTLPDGTDIVDITMNFFMARKETLEKVKWRRQLKICEHMDFFLRAKEMGVKVGNVKSARCNHLKAQGTRNGVYREHRNRKNKFNGILMRALGIESCTHFNGSRTTYPGKLGQNGKMVKRPMALTAAPVNRKKSLIERFPQLFKKPKK